MGEKEVATPALLCAIGNAGSRLWSLRGFDLFLFEDRLVVARVTMKETWSAFREFDRGLKKPMKAALAQRMRLDARARS